MNNSILELKTELSKVEAKLTELRERWHKASPSLRKCISVIGKIEKEKKLKLERQLEFLESARPIL